MTFEDMDLDSDLEPAAPPPPEESGNRTFLIAAGVLGGITVIALICMVLYALVLLPRRQSSQQRQVATINAQNTQVALAITQTASALRVPTHTPEPTQPARPPWLGILGLALNSDIANQMGLPPGLKGVLITGLEPGSPVEGAGLQPGTENAVINGQNVPIGGDVLLAIDGKPVSTPQDVENILSGLEPGVTVNLTILRGGTEQTIPVVLTPKPEGAIPTPTPVVVVATPTKVTTFDPRTATVAALLTQAAINTQTVVPTSTALPQTGFADEVGLPAMLILAVLLIAVIFIARRLRTAN